MTKTSPEGRETRVLVVAPVGRDAPMACAALREHGVAAEECADVEELCREAARGAGALLVTKEALTGGGAERLAAALGGQPAWSDLPLIVLTRGGAAESETLAALGALGALGSVAFVERPARIITILSVVKSALRARLRQYEVRDHLDALARAKQEHERLLASEQAARRHAESTSRLKDEFLATVSHELRTPLTAIIGWTHMLRRGPADPATIARGLEVIERNGESQLHLIEDLLDISRIISGKLLLDVRPVDLASVVGAALDAARPAAEAKRIQLRKAEGGRRIEEANADSGSRDEEARRAAGTPAELVNGASPINASPIGESPTDESAFRLPPSAIEVMGDADRLQQVVWNLVNNAVKFTPEGGRVEVRLAREGAGVRIDVSDTGAGIAPDFLPYVFDRFRQADPTTTRAHGGLGLGLSIVRQLVELHGGTVAVASEGEGRGSTFTVRLPAAHPSPRGPAAGESRAAAAAVSAHETGRGRLAGVRILVVEDDGDARELFSRTLSECGARVTPAATAAAALAAVERERPDVMVADIGMPGEDGYSLIARVRALPPERGGLTPAAALTAYARPEDRTRALGAGFQTHLSKPVKAADLVAAVAALARRNDEGKTGNEARAGGDRRKATVDRRAKRED